MVSGLYTLRLTVTDKSGNISTASIVVFVDSGPPVILSALSAFPVSIVPENGGTSISYRLSETADVRVMVVDRGTGKRLWMAPEDGLKQVPPGEHVISWDGRNEQGVTVGSGKYSVVVSAKAGAVSQRKSVILSAISYVDSIARQGAGSGAPSFGGPVTSVSVPSGGTSGTDGSGPVSSGVPASTSPTASDSTPTIPSGTSSGTHDNGMGNGKNPKYIDRGSNPGNHGSNK
jgi:hypothetical protein